MTVDPRVARTRQKVMDAAWSLLNEIGFDGITVEMVCERSGVARSTLYRHWRSVPEVLRDAFAARADDGTSPAPPDDARTALVAYAQAFAVGLTDHWGRAATSLVASAATDPAQRAVQQVFVQGTRRDLAAVLARAGLDDGDEQVDRVVDLLVAPMFYRYQFTDRPFTAEQAERLAEQAWAALRTG